MKESKPHPLLRSDISPYMCGCNIARFTNSSCGDEPEISMGEISSMSLNVEGGTEIVKAVTIKLNTLARVRDAVSVSGTGDSKKLHMIDESFKQGLELSFENPIMTKKRSPLTFTSGTDQVEISHVTDLVRKFLEIKPALDERLAAE